MWWFRRSAFLVLWLMRSEHSDVTLACFLYCFSLLWDLIPHVACAGCHRSREYSIALASVRVLKRIGVTTVSGV